MGQDRIVRAIFASLTKIATLAYVSAKFRQPVALTEGWSE